MPRRLPTAAAAVLSLAMLAGACSSSPKKSTSTANSSTTTTAAPQPGTFVPPSGNVTLTETGSSLLYPLLRLWVPDYNKTYPNITINTASTNSGTGIVAVTSNEVNIGASDAFVAGSQTAAKSSLLNIAIAVSAQVIEYNVPGVTGNLKLNGLILSDMYQGVITNWDDPMIAKANPGVTLPNLPVVPVYRMDGSGDTFLFTSYLTDRDPKSWGERIGAATNVAFPAVPGNKGVDGNRGMVTTCGATKGCIAYLGISYLPEAAQAGLGEAQVENGAGQYVLPNPQTIQAELASFAKKTPANESISLINGPGYPIVNYEYAIVNTKQSSSSTAQAIRAFLAWASDPARGGQLSYLNQVNFQPLPTNVVALSMTQISKIQ